MKAITNTNADTLLQYMEEKGIIKIDEVLKDFENMKDKEILKEHKYEIYYSETEKSWRTYLPDDSKPNKRKPLKRRDRANLEKEIVRFYKEKQKEDNRTDITLDRLYQEWLIYRRDYTSVKPKTIQEDMSEWNRFFKGSSLATMKVKEIRPITLI